VTLVVCEVTPGVAASDAAEFVGFTMSFLAVDLTKDSVTRAR